MSVSEFNADNIVKSLNEGNTVEVVVRVNKGYQPLDVLTIRKLFDEQEELFAYRITIHARDVIESHYWTYVNKVLSRISNVRVDTDPKKQELIIFNLPTSDMARTKSDFTFINLVQEKSLHG